jgi:hypothetical protein
MYVDSNDFSDTLHFVSQSKLLGSKPQVTLYHGRCDAAARLLTFEASVDVDSIELPRELSGIDEETGQTVTATAQLKKVEDIADPYQGENLAALRKEAPLQAARLDLMLSAAKSVNATVLTKLGSVQRTPVPTFVSSANLPKIAQNQSSTSPLGMRASGSTVGNRRIHAQAMLAIEDVGGRFSGTWFVSHARHVLDRRGYHTEFQCQR